MRSRALDSLRDLLDDPPPRPAPPSHDTARSRAAEDVSPDPTAGQDRLGPRSPFLQRMDQRSQIPVVKGPLARLVNNKPQLDAGKLVDAINAARERARQSRGY